MIHDQSKRLMRSSGIHRKWNSVYRTTDYISHFEDAAFRVISNELPSPPAELLDVGCGTGEKTLRFAQSGYQCLGIDLSDWAIQEAKTKAGEQTLELEGRATFEVLEIEELSRLSNNNDVVHCRGVLMHIQDWRYALSKISSKLRLGGKLLIIENNVQAPAIKLAAILRRIKKSDVVENKTRDGLELWKRYDDGKLLTRVMDLDVLRAALEQNGLAVQKVMPFGLINIATVPKVLGMRRFASFMNRAVLGKRVFLPISASVLVVCEKVSDPKKGARHKDRKRD